MMLTKNCQKLARKNRRYIPFLILKKTKTSQLEPFMSRSMLCTPVAEHVSLLVISFCEKWHVCLDVASNMHPIGYGGHNWKRSKIWHLRNNTHPLSCCGHKPDRAKVWHESLWGANIMHPLSCGGHERKRSNIWHVFLGESK